MGGEVLGARSPDSPSDKFQGDVKEGERAGKGGGVDRKFGATYIICSGCWKLECVCRLRAEHARRKRVKM